MNCNIEYKSILKLNIIINLESVSLTNYKIHSLKKKNKKSKKKAK